MSVVLVSLDSRSLQHSDLHAATSGPGATDLLLDVVKKSDHVTEVVVLATCMRTEIYVDALRFHGAVGDIRSALALVTGVDQSHFAHALVELHDESAIAHLFRVAAGLRSPVLGETEVLGQVARAWAHAVEKKTCGPVLGALFRAAVETGKSSRTQTAISRGVTSIAQAAVTMASEHAGGLAGKRVLVVGAGEMGEGMAAAASLSRSASEVLIANRTVEKAEQVAGRSGGRVVPFSQIDLTLADCDVVLTSTGAGHTVISADDVTAAMHDRTQPLVIVDMAVPRDVEESAADVEGVQVLDLDDLSAFTAAGREARQQEVQLVEQIVEKALAAYRHEVNARSVAPVIKGLRDKADGVRVAEVARYRKDLATLDPQQAAAVESLTKTSIAKLLHDPTVRLKTSAGTADGERLAVSLRSLFDL